MAYNMKGEDDLLEGRQSSTMGSERSVSGMSALSNTSSSAHLDARLLSSATSQATIAARSILISGGTEETALKTGKAAAQSVLLANLERRFLLGPKGIFIRRKIKKQAEVVASMALVSAINSIRNNQWDTLPSNGTTDDHLRMMQVQCDLPMDSSTISSPGVTSRGGSFPSSPSKAIGQKPPRFIKKTGSTPRAVRSRAVDTIPEEPSEPSILSDETSDQSICRPVAIRVETTQTTMSPQSHQNTRSPVTSLVSATSFFPSAKSVRNPVTSPDSTKSTGNPATSPANTMTPRSVRHRDLADGVPDEDPIYAMTTTPHGSDDTEDTEEDGRLALLPSVSTEDTEGDSIGNTTQGTDGTDFMAKAVDPYIFSFTKAFNCITTCDAPIEEKHNDVLQVASLESLESLKSVSRNVRDEIFPSASSGESSEPSRDYNGHALSNGSTDDSTEGEKPMTAKQSLRQKMSKIIGPPNDRSSQRKMVQGRSGSSSESEDRGQYSSDSREDIESGVSSDSSGSSSSSGTEESRQHGQKSYGFGGRSRRQRRNNAEMEDSYV